MSAFGKPAKGAAALLAALALSALSGCGVLPPRPASPVTRAIADGGATMLGRVAAASLTAGYESGFQFLPVASAAYETRLALANFAERTLDVQTFVFNADDTGKYLLDSLRATALRGVRVRLLIDDLNTAGSDALLSAFAGLPNVQVRLFNPFASGRSSLPGRLLASLHDIGRVNHRMHNKVFVADNALAVFGGRNVGNEYFMRATAGNFVDFDVLGAGKVVGDLSATFDDYWNSDYAYDIDAIVPRRATPDATAAFRGQAGDAEPPPLDETVPVRLERYVDVPADIAAGRLKLVAANATVVADPTDKIAGSRLRDRGGTVRDFISGLMRASRQEVFVVSPYFVPGELGMQAMRAQRAANVHLILLTNSLAATDEPMVHGGYLRYRREMLELGVDIYELSPGLARQANSLGRFRSTSGSLHAKIVVIDRARLFVGSMNLDSRSERYNTELGVVIDSPELAQAFLQLMQFEGSAYRLRLGATGQVEWVQGQGDASRVFHEEPEASAWLQFKARVLGIVVPEGWL